MKKSIVLFLALFSLNYAYSQITDGEKKLREAKKDTVEGWKTGGMVMLNFGQTSLTNWSAGGENTVSGNGLFNFFANYQKGNVTWDNTLDLGYGILKQGSQNRKSDDKIDFSTKFGKMASKNWYYSALLDFRSQFTAGYNYPNDSVKISNFFAPAYIVTAIGMDYKPNKTFTAFIAPITGKTTIVGDQDLADVGAFGVDSAKYDINRVKIKDGKNFRQEFGGYIRVAYQNDIMTNVNLSTKIDLFSNYLKNPQNIDVNWQVLVSMKVNKFISATFSTHLIYDDDTKIEGSPKVQFKEILGVGFSYKF
jgi:hypothetical protein